MKLIAIVGVSGGVAEAIEGLPPNVRVRIVEFDNLDQLTERQRERVWQRAVESATAASLKYQARKDSIDTQLQIAQGLARWAKDHGAKFVDLKGLARARRYLKGL